jgi:hypothetical protein
MPGVLQQRQGLRGIARPHPYIEIAESPVRSRNENLVKHGLPNGLIVEVLYDTPYDGDPSLERVYLPADYIA